MIRGVSHIGIAVYSIEKSLELFRDILGLKVAGIEEIPHEGVRAAILPVGATRIELLEPLGEESPLHEILKKRGEGIHHLALLTENLEETVDCLKKNGISTLGASRKGAEECLITFVHPKKAHGVLMEFCQENSGD